MASIQGFLAAAAASGEADFEVIEAANILLRLSQDAGGGGEFSSVRFVSPAVIEFISIRISNPFLHWLSLPPMSPQSLSPRRFIFPLLQRI
jgi:hypothetical protein